MAPKLRSQTRTNTSWSHLPTEIRRMIIAEVALAVYHDSISAPTHDSDYHDPVQDTTKPLNFITHISYNFSQNECAQVLEGLATDLSFQEYRLDEKIYQHDNIVDEGDSDDSEDESDDDNESEEEVGQPMNRSRK